MIINKSDKNIWTGIYKGVSFEINNWKTPSTPFDLTEKDNWTYYLFIHLNRIPKENDPDSFWIKGVKDGRHIYYDYHKHPIINNIELSGGCTWYSKESGFDGAEKIIKIGCDYQHIWNEDHSYDIEYIKKDVKDSIDKFIELIPGYKYWCCGNGKLYSLKDGRIKNGKFYSREYWGDKEWFKLEDREENINDLLK